MIYLYSGTPGSGKSLHAAQVIVNRSRQGRPVIANFEADLSKYKKANFTYVSNEDLTPDFLMRYALNYFVGKRVKEEAILLVIDEAQLIFNSREWDKKMRMAWISFFSQHRKYGYRIILIAQFDRMLDRQIRSLIEYEFIHRKVSNYGWQGWLLGLLRGGKLFIAVQRWYPLKKKIDHEYFVAKKKYYQIYDTFGTFLSDGAGAAAKKKSGVSSDASQTGGPAVSSRWQQPQPSENIDKAVNQDVILEYTKYLIESEDGR